MDIYLSTKLLFYIKALLFKCGKDNVMTMLLVKEQKHLENQKKPEIRKISKNSEISEFVQLFKIGDTVKISAENTIATVIAISNTVLCMDPETENHYVSNAFHYGLEIAGSEIADACWRHGFQNSQLELVKRGKPKKDNIPKYKIGNLVKLTKSGQKGIIGKISSITRMTNGKFVYHIYDVDGSFSDDEAKRINIIQRLLMLFKSLFNKK